MGFLDKAKKLAEQAQTKLDEVQTQFNEKQNASAGAGDAVEYDKHGRPVATPAAPAETATPPHGDALAPTPEAPPAAPPAPPAPSAASEPPAEGEDRNRPSYEPPKLSGGDPLA